MIVIDDTVFNIKEDIMKLFIERLFDNCHTPLKVEEVLMDYALSGKFTHKELYPDDDCCDSCDYVFMAEDRVEDLEKEVRSLEEDLDMERKMYNDLKENSILFSMEDI